MSKMIAQAASRCATSLNAAMHGIWCAQLYSAGASAHMVANKRFKRRSVPCCNAIPDLGCAGMVVVYAMQVQIFHMPAERREHHAMIQHGCCHAWYVVLHMA